MAGPMAAMVYERRDPQRELKKTRGSEKTGNSHAMLRAVSGSFLSPKT